jgi:hypothetical protein
MDLKGRLKSGVLALSAMCLSASAASAGPLWDRFFPDDGPTPSYSSARYWAPGVARVHDNRNGPKICVYAPAPSDVVPDVLMLKYRCPAANPGDTLIQPPTPPVDSRFRY